MTRAEEGQLGTEPVGGMIAAVGGTRWSVADPSWAFLPGIGFLA